MGGSDSDMPSTLTGRQIQECIEETTMSQYMDLFEETGTMSEEPLKYSREPLKQFPEQTMLTSELDRMGVPSHFDEPEDVQV